MYIVWFRRDLRLRDNPAFFEATQRGPVIAIYAADPTQEYLGEASRWWLYESLKNLSVHLDHKLHFYKGSIAEIMAHLVQTYPIQGVYVNRGYEPSQVKQEKDLIEALKPHKIPCSIFNSSLLFEPEFIKNKEKNPYKVYSAFSRSVLDLSFHLEKDIPAADKTHLIKKENEGVSLKELDILPTRPWYKKFSRVWKVGEEEATKKLNSFLKRGLQDYESKRNFPAEGHVSRLSPHLHFGEISPRQVFQAVQTCKTIPSHDRLSYIKELIWREFAAHTLFHFPQTAKESYKTPFDHLKWHKNENLLKAWQKGQTGYPFVDAGMRELWQTGYMHNRVRMVVASFLVKNLQIRWQEGADWFLDCLVDADLANNSMNWQWVAGCGVDAAPYFRVFNPTLQAQKFDPKGIYIKKFIPELKDLPLKYLFTPWEAPENILNQAKVVLGKNYPHRIWVKNSA